MWLAFALTLLQAPTPAPAATDEALHGVMADYVGLYKREMLDRWRGLFLPTFTATHTRADGTVRVRTLEEFFNSQKEYLASGRAIKEELENLQVDRRGKLATAWADFVLTEEGEKSRGKLVLLLVADRGQWRIQALMFAYDGE